jgi:uncharacterized protein YifE (UPF0438 family)
MESELRRCLKTVNFKQRLPKTLRFTGKDGDFLSQWGATLSCIESGVLDAIKPNEVHFVKFSRGLLPAEGESEKVWLGYKNRQRILITIRHWFITNGKQTQNRDAVKNLVLKLANEFDEDPGLIDIAISEISEVDGREFSYENSSMSETNPVDQELPMKRPLGHEDHITWADYNWSYGGLNVPSWE